MAQRENINIRTKYTTMEMFKDQCIDHFGHPKAATTWNRGLWGYVDEEGLFNITAGNKGAGLFIFRGKGEIINGHVHLRGNIGVIQRGKWAIYISVGLMTLLGLVMILSGNPMGIIVGFFMMLMPWTNYLYMRRSDALYKMILRKVTDN